MKTLINIVILNLVTSFSWSQTYTTDRKVDSLLFTRINEYRVFNKLQPIQWDERVYQMAKHHTVYLSITNEVTHFETKTLKNFKLLKTPDDRFRFFVNKALSPICNENAQGGNYDEITDSTGRLPLFINSIWHKKANQLTAEDIMVFELLYNWTTSTSHNQNLLDKKFTKGAVSVLYSSLKRIKSSIFRKGKPTITFKAYSTSNFISLDK